MIGERLRKLREGKKLSVRQLSRLAKVPHETISRLENSNQRTASLPVMMRLANALGVSLDYLAGMDKLYGGTEGQYKPVSMEELGGTPHTDEHQPLLSSMNWQRYHSMSEVVVLPWQALVPAHHPRCFHSCQGCGSIAAKRRRAPMLTMSTLLFVSGCGLLVVSTAAKAVAPLQLTVHASAPGVPQSNSRCSPTWRRRRRACVADGAIARAIATPAGVWRAGFYPKIPLALLG